MKLISFFLFNILSLAICTGQSVDLNYTIILEHVETKRSQFESEYSNSQDKEIIIEQARSYILDELTNTIFPYWYGTPWDFNGTTRTPRQGHIACGYFITNTLTDIGFQIPRIKWAQSASEMFIKKLAPHTIKRFSNKPISNIEKYLLQSGDGLYIVGLDAHVGYILVKNNTIQFIHASYYDPEIGVTSENLSSSNPLTDSNYRVIGKLLSDKMIINWLQSNRYY